MNPLVYLTHNDSFPEYCNCNVRIKNVMNMKAKLGSHNKIDLPHQPQPLPTVFSHHVSQPYVC